MYPSRTKLAEDPMTERQSQPDVMGRGSALGRRMVQIGKLQGLDCPPRSLGPRRCHSHLSG